MWTVSMLKENAKAALRNFYWPAFFVCLIVSILTGGFSSTGNSGASDADVGDFSGYFDEYNDGSAYDDYYNDYYDDYDDYYDSYDEYYPDDDAEGFFDSFRDSMEDTEFARLFGIFGTFVTAIVIISMLFGIAYSLLFANPLKVGCNRFFLDARMGYRSVGNLFSQFKSGTYKGCVKNMFIMNLKLFAWSLFIIIPIILMISGLKNVNESTSMEDLMTFAGMTVLVYLPLMFIALIPNIIKSYEYFLVPYITAENPSLDTKRVFEISRLTMKGEKMHCFGLQLSFIGWFILGGFAGSICAMFLGTVFGAVAASAGMAFVYPYFYATLAEFYCCMREKAMATGISDSFELCGAFGRAAAQPFPQQNDFMPYRSTSENVNSSGTYPAANMGENAADNGLFGESKPVSLEKPPKNDEDDYQGPEIR